MTLRHRARLLAAATLAAAPTFVHAQDRGATALGGLVAGLDATTRVLVVGAHPDDEDGPLIAYLARGRHVRTAYLSLTRGEGGANLVGAETGIALGVVRTAESLAAREVDGAEQFFTRAYDFGASKSGGEALARWRTRVEPDAVLGDVVTIVRAFRPHVVVTMHALAALDANGQHQAAARIVADAFAAAADTMKYSPAAYGPAWAPAKLYRVAPPNEAADTLPALRVDVGEYSPALGRTWVEVGAESRARHRTQGGAVPATLGASWQVLRLVASRVGGGPAREERSIFDGIDTSLARVRRAGLSEPLLAAIDSLGPAIARVRTAFRADDPGSAIAPLAALTPVAARAAALGGFTMRGVVYDPDVARTLEDVWRRARAALVVASGVAVEATAGRETVAAVTRSDSSDTVRVDVAVYNRGGADVRVTLATMTGGPNVALVPNATVPPDSVWRGTLAMTPHFLTTPWWNAAGTMGDLYAQRIDGRTEREWQQTNESGSLVASVRLRIAGGEAFVSVPVTFRPTEPSRVAERPVAVVPGIGIRLDNAVQYARADAPLARPLRVTVQSAYAVPRDVQVTLVLPPPLVTDSATRTVTLPAGATGVLTYMVRGTPMSGPYVVKALAVVGTERFDVGGALLAAEHVPPQRLYGQAQMRINAVPVSIPTGTFIGYVPGAAERASLMLTQLGVPVSQLDPAAFALSGSRGLARYTAIVLGPRAYETNPALLSANGLLFEYARAGGVVVVQGGQYLMEQPGVLPYPITLGRPAQSVIDEDAPVRVLDARAPVLAAPNRLGADDFASWVQERAQFVPASFDPRWRSAIETADAGETPNPGTLLVASVGRGAYVYTTLSLHRQLAAGNPGAARLFVNLLSARAPATARSAPRTAPRLAHDDTTHR